MESKNVKIIMVSGKARSGKDTICEMFGQIYKERNVDIINLQFAAYLKEYAKKITGWDGADDETKPRQLLQTLGTEVIRKKIDFDFFVKRIISDIKVYSYYYDVITVSDVRTKNELDIPKCELDNIVTIRINRPNFDNGLTEEQKNHYTEVDLDDYENFDYIITNDGSLEDLEKKVRDLVGVIENES